MFSHVYDARQPIEFPLRFFRHPVEKPSPLYPCHSMLIAFAEYARHFLGGRGGGGAEEGKRVNYLCLIVEKALNKVSQMVLTRIVAIHDIRTVPTCIEHVFCHRGLQWSIVTTGRNLN